MAGFVNVGRSYASNAMSGMRRSADLETARENENREIKAAERAQGLNMAASGAGVGFMVGGPIGAGVGAAGGYLLSSIF